MPILETFYIIAAKRSDGSVPKLVKALHDLVYFDPAEATVEAADWAKQLDRQFEVYEFRATPVGRVAEAAKGMKDAMPTTGRRLGTG